MANKQKIVLLLEGDAKGAVKATQVTGKGLDSVKDKGKSAAKQLRDVTNRAAKYGAVAGGAAAAGVAVMIKRQLDVIDNTAKASDKLGIATERLTAMRIQAELTGVAQQTLDKGTQQMVRGIADAAEGTGEAVDALAKLQLQATELKKLSPDQQFYAIADAMEEVENQTDRVQIAYDLFGARGVALVNTLKGGSAAALEAQQFTEQWGLAINRVDASKIEQANDAMTLVSRASEGFWKQLTVNVSPAIAGVAKELLGVGEEAGSAEELADKAFASMVKGAGFVADMGRGLHVVFVGLKKIVAESWATIFEGIAAIDSAITDLLNKLPEWAGGGDFQENQFIQGFAQSLRTVADETGQQLGDLVERAMPSDVLAAKVEEWERAAEKAGNTAAESANVSAEAYERARVKAEGLSDAEQKRLDKATDLLSTTKASNALLEREMEAVSKGEAALAAFNREKYIENGLRGKSADDLLPAEIAEYRELLGEQYDLKQSIKDLTDQADPYADAWQAAVERIDSAFADAWKGAFDSFEDFADQLENAFKQLLAELAHQAITKPIVIQLSSSIQGALMPGGLSGLGGLFGGGAGASQGALMSGGAYTGAAGGGVGASIIGGLSTAGIGAAAAYGLNAQLGAVGNLSSGSGNRYDYLDAAFPGLGSVAGKASEALFGSGKRVFNTGYELGVEAGELIANGFTKYKKDGGLTGGTSTSSKLTDASGIFGDQFSNTKSLLTDAYAALGITITDAAFEGVSIAADRVGTRKKSDEEFAAAVDAMLASFADALAEGAANQTGTGLGLQEVTALASALTSVNSIMRTFNRGLHDVSIDGAEAAQGVIALAGGIDQLLAQTQAAYQFDTAFGLADGLDPLRATLDNLGFTLAQVESVAQSGSSAIGELFAELSDAEKAALSPFISQLQSLVPALNAAEKAAAELYGLETELLRVQGDTAALRERTLDSLISDEARAIQEKIWLLEDQAEADAAAAEAAKEAQRAQEQAQEAAQRAAEEFDRTMQRLSGLASDIRQYVRGLAVSDYMGNPLQQSQNALQQFRDMANAAMGGDEDAARGLVRAADDTLRLAEAAYASGASFQAVLNEVQASLGSVADTIEMESYAEKQLRLLEEIGAGIGNLGESLMVELTATAESEILKLITYVTDTTDLPDDLKELALSTGGTFTQTVDFIVGSELSSADKTLALSTTGVLAKTLDFVTGQQLPPQILELALTEASSLLKTIDAQLARGADLSAIDIATMGDNYLSTIVDAVLDSGSNQQALDLAFATGGTISQYVQALKASGSNADAEALANAYSSTITKTIQASGGTLTADQQAILNALNGSSNVSLSGDVLLQPGNELASIFYAIRDLNQEMKGNDDYFLYHYMMQTEQTQTILWEMKNVLTDELYYNRIELQNIDSTLQGTLRVASNNQDNGTWAKFAMGGAFTNSVVSTPTAFDMGLMGEAGPEAIMPLTRMPGGELGVRSMNDNQREIVAELRSLRRDYNALMNRLSDDVNHHTRVTAAGSKRTIGELQTLNRTTSDMDEGLRVQRLEKS